MSSRTDVAAICCTVPARSHGGRVDRGADRVCGSLVFKFARSCRSGNCNELEQRGFCKPPPAQCCSVSLHFGVPPGGQCAFCGGGWSPGSKVSDSLSTGELYVSCKAKVEDNALIWAWWPFRLGKTAGDVLSRTPEGVVSGPFWPARSAPEGQVGGPCHASNRLDIG